jgi:hypothetical protein
VTHLLPYIITTRHCDESAELPKAKLVDLGISEFASKLRFGELDTLPSNNFSPFFSCRCCVIFTENSVRGAQFIYSCNKDLSGRRGCYRSHSNDVLEWKRAMVCIKLDRRLVEVPWFWVTARSPFRHLGQYSNHRYPQPSPENPKKRAGCKCGVFPVTKVNTKSGLLGRNSSEVAPLTEPSMPNPLHIYHMDSLTAEKPKTCLDSADLGREGGCY